MVGSRLVIQGTTVIFIDSNVFLMDLRYPRDVNASTNSRFLARMRERGDAGTSTWSITVIPIRPCARGR